jgi:hypothetical protein
LLALPKADPAAAVVGIAPPGRETERERERERVIFQLMQQQLIAVAGAVANPLHCTSVLATAGGLLQARKSLSQ